MTTTLIHFHGCDRVIGGTIESTWCCYFQRILSGMLHVSPVVITDGHLV